MQPLHCNCYTTMYTGLSDVCLYAMYVYVNGCFNAGTVADKYFLSYVYILVILQKENLELPQNPETSH